MGVLLAAGCNHNGSAMSYDDGSQLGGAWQGAEDQPPTPRTLYAMSRILVEQGRDDQAKYVLTRIVRDHPSFLPAYVELAELQMRQRQTEAALDTLAQGLQRAPRDAVLLNNMGMVYLFRGENSQAMNFFRRASAESPDNARYRSNLALALGLMGRYDESIAAYKQVLEECDAHYNVAVICESREDYDRAGQEYAAARQLQAGRRPLLVPEGYRPEPTEGEGQVDQAMDVDAPQQ
jgi:Flp pilus assembly protein TadD